MRSIERKVFIDWVIAYAANPNANPSTTQGQAVAIRIHSLMSDGKWRTAKAIANELNEDLYLVRDVMFCIRTDWGYESSKSKYKGYKRI